MLEKINDLINNCEFDNNKIYLLDFIDENNGFLFNGSSVWFISKNLNNLESKNIQTQYLILRTNLYISGVSETNYYKADYYNVIMFKDYNEKELLDIFISLCGIYVLKQKELTFEHYFEILIDLFQMETKEKNLSIIGLFGELSFIKYIYLNHEIDLSPYWHVKSPFDKHDFSLPSVSLEIKTTLKPELRFLLNHSQIFTNKDIFAVLIRLSESGNGETIKDLIDFFNNTKTFNQNLRFIFAVNSALTKIKLSKFDEYKYDIEDIKYYYNKDLVTISEIPKHITSISYYFDFSGQKDLNHLQFVKRLNTKLKNIIE